MPSSVAKLELELRLLAQLLSTSGTRSRDLYFVTFSSRFTAQLHDSLESSMHPQQAKL